MDAKELPERPSLKQYENQAEDFFKAFASGDSVALEHIRELAELPRTPTQEELRAHAAQRLMRLRKSGDQVTEISIDDARLLVADLYCFESWQTLAEHVEAINDGRSDVVVFESGVDAVVSGAVATLTRLLKEHPELIRARSKRRHHATLLHYVSANGVEDFRQKTPPNAVEVAKTLLDSGAEVDAVLSDGESTTLGLVATSVHPLVAGVQIELLDLLLERGAAVDGIPGGWNPLLASLHNGRGEAAEFLADRGARLDLEGAAGAGRLDVVKSYFNKDGSLKENATKDQVESGFAWACQFGRTSVAEFLLEHGVKIDAGLKHDGQSGLHWAAYAGHADTVRLLLERKAPVDVKDESYGGTPLGWALYGWGESARESERRSSRYDQGRNYYDVVELLVAAGAEVDREWLAHPYRENLSEKVNADPRMVVLLEQ